MGDQPRTRIERGDLKLFGREWRVGPRSELLAATIRMPEFLGPQHAHAEAQIAILLSGSSATFSREGVRGSVHSPIAPGSFAYIRPGELHGTQWRGWTELLNLYWDAESLRELADQSGCSLNEKPASYCIDQAISSVGRILMDDFLRTGTLMEMIIDHGRALAASRLFQLVEKRTTLLPTGLLSQKRLQNAIDAIVENPERAFTLVELARLCHSSVFHFARSFTAHVGCAPFAFQRSRRVEKAKELLRNTDLSVEAISHATGIESSTSFSRIFRQAVGQSPREYRQRNAPDLLSHVVEPR